MRGAPTRARRARARGTASALALLALASSAALLASSGCAGGPSCDTYAATRARCPGAPGRAPSAALYEAVCETGAAVNPAVAHEVACAGDGRQGCDTFWRCVHQQEEAERAAEVSAAGAAGRWDYVRLVCEDPTAAPTAGGPLMAACRESYATLAQAREADLRRTRDRLFPADLHAHQPSDAAAPHTAPHKSAPPSEDALKQRCAEEDLLAVRLAPGEAARLEALCQQVQDALAARRAEGDAATNLKGHKRYIPASCRRAAARLKASDAPDVDGWRERAHQRVAKACYVELGAAILEAELAKPHGARGSCGHATREVLRAVDDLGLRAPSMDRAVARVRRRCAPPGAPHPKGEVGATRPARVSPPRRRDAPSLRGSARSRPTRPGRAPSRPR